MQSSSETYKFPLISVVVSVHIVHTKMLSLLICHQNSTRLATSNLILDKEMLSGKVLVVVYLR